MATDPNPDSTQLDAATPPLVQSDLLAPDTRVGRYRIVALVGEGGMGRVYRAEQLEPVQRIVALKLIRGASQADAEARFGAADDGDADQHRAAVVGVTMTLQQALAFHPLDQLGHRRLTDTFQRGQGGQPGRALAVDAVEQQCGRAAEVGAVTEVPHAEVDAEVEGLPELVVTSRGVRRLHEWSYITVVI